MPIQLLDDHYPWLANHAGFSMLPKALTDNGCPNNLIRPRGGILARAIGKSYSVMKGFPRRPQAVAASECEFYFKMRLGRSGGHILFLENHLLFLSLLSKTDRWIGTIHLPRKCWKTSDLRLLRALPVVSVLCDSMRDQFDDLIDRSRITVLSYGVDTSFFKPALDSDEVRPQRLIFVGAWLRNTAMLARIIPETSRRFPDVVFELVVPLHARGDHALSALRSHSAVRWHHNLSDEDLRGLYQSSNAMLLPMIDGGANNAVVEALACGLPIITTDVGGIRSYGGGTVFPTVKNDDDSSCLNLIATYLTDAKFTSTVSRNCRSFAEAKLEWRIAAKEYVSVYHSLGLVGD